LRQTRCARKIPKPVLKTTLITKETTYYLDFGEYFVVSFWSHSIRAFFSALGRFIEDLLRNLTFWEKTKYGVTISSYKIYEKKFSLACGKKMTCFLLGWQ
jgi:hypothetical protein